jgi:acyl-CoA synthetase (NDP forming)
MTGGRPSVAPMLGARSVALVGASPRPGSFGERLVLEVARSPGPLEVHLVNPRHREVAGRPCLPSLDAIEDPVDLVLLGVPDDALEEELSRAAGRGDRSAVVFGSVFGPSGDGQDTLRQRVTDIAAKADMAVCGGGCMGFVNVTSGLRAVGYVEPDPLPAGPVGLVTHSGSVFSALLRTHRRIGFTVAVSSGQELVTPAADYMEYALGLPGTRVLALVLETLRAPDAFRAALGQAAARDIAVVALTVGGSPGGRAMVAAHSGALAGDDGAWEALFDAYGVIRVSDLDEMADTLELLGAGRRARGRAGAGGIASVHDSGAERALVMDVAADVGLAFAPLSDATLGRLREVLDPGLEAMNPLDVWGTGADTRIVVGGALQAMADDPAVAAVVLGVDLVAEFDGDDSYPLAMADAAEAVDVPVAVVSNIHSAVDQATAGRLRAQGIPVLEGTRTGLLALRHLLDRRDARRGPPPAAPPDGDRRQRWRARLRGGPLAGSEALALVADYGIECAPATVAASREEAADAARAMGFPVVLKTDDAAITHKTDVGGVVLGLGDADAVAAAYDDLARRLGPRVLVSRSVPADVELALGLVRDPLVGPLVVVGAGGVLVEILHDRSLSLPPLDVTTVERLLDRLGVAALLHGVRGRPGVDRGALVRQVLALSRLAEELGEDVDAVDVNPLRCGPGGAVAVDAVVVGRRGGPGAD